MYIGNKYTKLLLFIILALCMKVLASDINSEFKNILWLNEINKQCLSENIPNDIKQPFWIHNDTYKNTKQKQDIFANKLKKHFLDIDLYKQRVKESELSYRNFMKVLEHEGTYFIYEYSLPPYGVYGHNIPHELKFQLSLKVPIWRGAFWSKGTVFIGYTQTMWFQQFNSKYSNPVRDTNYKPSIFYSYPANWNLFGGKVKELHIGFLHYSNGIGGDECERNPDGIRPPNCRSRSASNRLMLEGIWEIDRFGVHISAWPYIPLRRDNPDLVKYMGYANLRLYYTHKKHFIEIHISPIITNYTKYYGSIQVGYAYALNRFVALYGQYFYGYGDSLYEYNILSHRIGIGLRAVGF